MKIGVVGDLSGGDPARLCAVLDNALIACDYVVQVGDLEPAYTQVQSRIATSGHKFFPVPGNHDTEYDSLGVPRAWRVDVSSPPLTLLGLDNSTGMLSDDSKALFATPKATGVTEFAFAHMPPCPLVLPDGTENVHGMVESGPNPDAAWLIGQLQGRCDAMFCGHYHGWTAMLSSPFGGPLIADGRGGAAPDLGYTLVTVTAEGWVLHSVGVALP